MILLVVDVQKALTEDEGLYNAGSFIENVTALISAARKNRTEVIYVQHDAGEGSGFSVGDEDFEIDSRVAPQQGEKIYIKKINSCFGNKDFAAYMEKQEDKRLMITGLQTDFCIDATVKSAFEKGYDVIVPEGANSTFDNSCMDGETTCRYFNKEIWPGCFAECVDMDEALEMLG